MTRGSGLSFAPGGHHLPWLSGGLIALVLPVLLAIPTLQAVLAGEDGGLDNPTAPIVSGVLFLVAAPTAWLFSLFDLAPGLTVILAAVTSLPLWFGLGVWLAGRTRRWRDWLARYLTVALIWAVGFLLTLAAIATLTG